MNRSVFALGALLLLAGCKEKRMIPRPDPNWMPLGGTLGSVTSLDTSRIGREGDARLVWIRIDSIRPDSAGDPVLVPGARRESLHRIRCAALTVEDLRIPAQGGRVPGPTDLVPVGRYDFAQHPYGSRTFPTVCGALGVVANIRAAEQEK